MPTDRHMPVGIVPLSVHDVAEIMPVSDSVVMAFKSLSSSQTYKVCKQIIIKHL